MDLYGFKRQILLTLKAWLRGGSWTDSVKKCLHFLQGKLEKGKNLNVFWHLYFECSLSNLPGPDHKFPKDCRGYPAYQQQSGVHIQSRQKGILIECNDRYRIRMEEEWGQLAASLKLHMGLFGKWDLTGQFAKTREERETRRLPEAMAVLPGADQWLHDTSLLSLTFSAAVGKITP